MKTIALTVAAALIAISANTASAKTYHDNRSHTPFVSHKMAKPSVRGGKLTRFERVKIQRKRAQVAALERRARADGRVTPRERVAIHAAQRQLAALIRKERRD